VGELAQNLARRLGWTIHRWPANRFEAMEDALRLLRRARFEPRVVVDIGANVGAWTDCAARVFDAREYHLVEPQTACHAALERFRPPRFQVHKVALTAEGTDSVVMVGGGDGGGTGAYVSGQPTGESDAQRYPAASLDRLLGDRVHPSERVLLKLDVEGHELQILGSSSKVLNAAEVVIMEFQMFEIERNGVPVLADLIDFMRQRRFMLYDVAALAARPRDKRLRMGDVVFASVDSALVADDGWE
jgi:FkbM family methyltransferase